MVSGLLIDSSDRILVVAPHQDDESIGCGGTVLKWGAAGAQTGVLWVSSTTTGEERSVEALLAAETLALSWTRSLGMPPVGLSAESAVLDAVVRAFREFSPSIILLPHCAEEDRQHRVAYELCLEAEWIAAYPLRFDLGDPVRRPRAVLAYEVWTPLERPALHCDITAYATLKRNAISCYESQVAIADFPDAALGLNRYRGVTSGVGAFAEAFAILKLHEGG